MLRRQPLDEPAHVLDGAGDLVLGHQHLADEEVAEELVEVLRDLARAEHPAEDVLLAVVEGGRPAVAVGTRQVLVGVAIEAVAEELERLAHLAGAPLAPGQPDEVGIDEGLDRAARGADRWLRHHGTR